jgi:uncharacterized protein
MYEMGMLANIVAHSFKVCQVAMFLVDNLKESKIDLDGELVTASALLHDITKTRSLCTGENHALTGAEIIQEMGCPEVAYIVGHHVVLDEDVMSEKPTEVEVVNYADKRVLHDRVVSLQERLDDLIVRYTISNLDEDRIKRNWLRAKSLEEKIFNLLPFSPGDLEGLLGRENPSKDIDTYHSCCTRWLLHPPHTNIFDEFSSIRVDLLQKILH